MSANRYFLAKFLTKHFQSYAVLALTFKSNNYWEKIAGKPTNYAKCFDLNKEYFAGPALLNQSKYLGCFQRS